MLQLLQLSGGAWACERFGVAALIAVELTLSVIRCCSVAIVFTFLAGNEFVQIYPGPLRTSLQRSKCCVGTHCRHYCVLYGTYINALAVFSTNVAILAISVTLVWLQRSGFMLIELAFAQEAKERRHVVVLVCTGWVVYHEMWMAHSSPSHRNSRTSLPVRSVSSSLGLTSYQATTLKAPPTGQ